jgi:3-oxoadipate enol-lactonase
MKVAKFDDVTLHYREDGSPDGPPVVFSNSLGTDLRLWDGVIERLPKSLRLIRYDKRGHGLSTVPDAPYSMGGLVRDAEQLLDHLNVRDCVFVGLSIGGIIAQGLAVKRMDQVRAMVLSNTGAKVGTKEIWADRVEGVRKGGIVSLADAVMERWFSKKFRATPELAPWLRMLINTPDDGYIGCSQAISNTDFYTPTSGLRLPTLAIAGSEDGATPPDLVRETAALIPGSRFELMRGSGHLPCVEDPDGYAELLRGFLSEVGHL